MAKLKEGPLGPLFDMLEVGARFRAAVARVALPIQRPDVLCMPAGRHAEAWC